MVRQWFDAFLLWAGFGGLGLTAAIGAAWFFGLMPILGAIAQLLAAALAPIVGALVQGVVWTWQNILWPALWRAIKDIFDDWVTIVVVGSLAAMVWFGVKALHEHQLRTKQQIINACYADLKKQKKPARTSAPAREEALPWPFSGW